MENFDSQSENIRTNNPLGLMNTHNAECLTLISTTSPFPVENIHYTSTGVCGYFTDPHDGRRYRMTIEATHVFSDEDKDTPLEESPNNASDKILSGGT